MLLETDIAIVGGGFIGATLAGALQASSWRVALVDAETHLTEGPAQWDERSFALARRSVETLRRLGIWQNLEDDAFPIRAVKAQIQGAFNTVRLRAEDYAMQALGFVVPARRLARAIYAQLDGQRIAHLQSAKLIGLTHDGDHGYLLEIRRQDQPLRLKARFVVGADGAHSLVREKLGIPAQQHDYGQTALVCAIELAQDHHGYAFELLGETGPFALLPLDQRRYGVVWSVSSDQSHALMQANDADFLTALQNAHGPSLPPIKRVGRRQAWPLRLIKAERVVAERAALLGNAAQAIHPVGAQGFNLGLRDVENFLACLDLAQTQQADIGDRGLWSAYAQARDLDRNRTIALGDKLLSLAKSNRALGDIGFFMAERLPWLKQALAFRFMGYSMAEELRGLLPGMHA